MQAAMQTGNFFHLWIGEEWYIPVDEKGRCKGVVHEGALGFVVKVHSIKDNHRYSALKLPKLTEETHRENAYVIELTEKELTSVDNISFISPQYLLTPITTGQGRLRDKVTRIDSAEGKKWEGAIIFTTYNKNDAHDNHPLSFVLVKFFDDKFEKYPKESPFPMMDKATFKKIEEQTRDHHGKEWARPVFVELRKNNPENAIGNTDDDSCFYLYSLEHALEKDSVDTTWIAGLPSIQYAWVNGTLQEAISPNTNEARKLDWEKWNTREHLNLLTRVCEGIKELHGNGMLHADVRPANIVYTGKPNESGKYFLIDYGSFAKPRSASAEARDPVDSAALAPVIRGEHASIFYARERGIGREWEHADIAILQASQTTPGAKDVYLILGWQSQVTTDSLAEIISKFDAETDNTINVDVDSQLCANDCIQVGNYIFKLLNNEQYIDNFRVMKCEYPFWIIHHSKIAVEYKKNIPSNYSFKISYATDLMQWSVASDLYSLGVLALYLIFHNTKYKNSHNINGYPNDRTYKQSEDDFREMLSQLTSRHYFNEIWPKLDYIRDIIEKHCREYTAQDLAKLAVSPYSHKNSNNSNAIPLLEELTNTVQLIIETSPGTKDLLGAFENNNIGHFLFFMHFILCCLHRQNHLDRNNLAKTYHPFCKSRLEQPGDNAAAQNALRRLNEIEDIISLNSLSKLTSAENEIGDYNLGQNTQIYQEIQQAKYTINDLEANRLNLEQALEDSKQHLSVLEERNHTIESKIYNINDVICKKVEAIEAARTALGDIITRYNGTIFTKKIIKEINTIKQELDSNVLD